MYNHFREKVSNMALDGRIEGNSRNWFYTIPLDCTLVFTTQTLKKEVIFNQNINSANVTEYIKHTIEERKHRKVYEVKLDEEKKKMLLFVLRNDNQLLSTARYL